LTGINAVLTDLARFPIQIIRANLHLHFLFFQFLKISFIYFVYLYQDKLNANQQMKLLTFKMAVKDESDGYFIHQVDHGGQTAIFHYHPGKKELDIPPDGSVAELLQRNRSQLMNILKTRRGETFYPGFRLKFILIDKKEVKPFNDMTNVIVLDRRNGEDEIFVIGKGISGIHEIFTDGCFLEEKNRSGIATVIKSPDGKYHLEHIASDATNNCLAELEAAINGFEILKKHTKIRLITDSRYVRKGLTEWMLYWRLNNWMTANAEPAKNISQWKKLDQLTAGKYIEVAWVKGHSGHFENTMCDLYARDAAESNLSQSLI
jgi:ribonuclease HI